MKNPDIFFYGSDQPWESPVGGVRRQVMGYDDNLMVVKVEFDAGSDGGGLHSHPHVQSSVVVDGVFEVAIGDQTRTLGAGDGYYVPSDVPHMARCIEKGTLIDTFSPARADFLK